MDLDRCWWPKHGRLEQSGGVWASLECYMVTRFQSLDCSMVTKFEKYKAAVSDDEDDLVEKWDVSKLSVLRSLLQVLCQQDEMIWDNKSEVMQDMVAMVFLWLMNLIKNGSLIKQEPEGNIRYQQAQIKICDEYKHFMLRF